MSLMAVSWGFPPAGNLGIVVLTARNVAEMRGWLAWTAELSQTAERNPSQQLHFRGDIPGCFRF